jgi:hypothetical protein
MAEENEHMQKTGSKKIVNSTVKAYGNDPFFVKKANGSKEVLEKHGLPKSLKKRSGRA